MRDRRCFTNEEATKCIFPLAIPVAPPLVLAQVLDPRIDEEYFDPTGFFSCNLKHAPAVGAIAPALGSHRIERGKKGLAVLRRDAVLD